MRHVLTICSGWLARTGGRSTAFCGESGSRSATERILARSDDRPCGGRAGVHDQSYWIAPEARSGKAYALLVQALARSDDVAVARIVLSTKEHLCLVRSDEGRLVLTTLIWADELQAPPEIARAATTAKELQMAEQLIRSMAGKFDARAFKDEHRARVEALVRKKAQGKTIEITAPAKAGQVVDLARALEQSLVSARRYGTRAGRGPTRARRRAPRAAARRSVRSR